MEQDLAIPILVYGWLRELPLLEKGPTGKRFGPLINACSETATGAATSVHTVLKRLPASLEELKDELDCLRKRFDAADQDGSRRALAPVLLREKMERLSHGIRHNHQNVLAAMRLLLGGFACGDLSGCRLNEASEALGSTGETSELLDLYQRWQTAAGSDATTEAPPRPAQPLPGKVLIVDDSLGVKEILEGISPKTGGDSGWQVVYEALFKDSHRFNCKLEFAESYDEGKAWCKWDKLSQIDLVILDVDLDEDPERSGLRLLQELRCVDPFVPILQMTAFDDAEICRLSLELQADAFFVKQFYDGEDRDSRAYYGKFVAMVQGLLADSEQHRERKRFKRFRNLLPQIVEQDQAALEKVTGDGGFLLRCLEEGVSGELVRLFMLLRMADRHHQFRTLLSSNQLKPAEVSHDELAITLFDAVLAWGNWFQIPGGNRVDRLGRLWDVVSRSRAPDSATQFLRGEETGTLVETCNKVRHARIAETPLANIRKLLLGFLDLVDASLRVLPEPANLHAGGAGNGAAIQDVSYAVRRARERQRGSWRSHSVRSRMGAEAALLGRYLATSDDETAKRLVEEYRVFGETMPAMEVIGELEESSESKGLSLPLRNPSPLRLCLVDDHGLENGWAYAMQLVHNGAPIRNIEFRGAPPGQDLRTHVRTALGKPVREADLLFVDLRMPAEKNALPHEDTGVGVIESIRNLDPLVPVVVLSAHLEAKQMRRALFHGANEFFPKEPPQPVVTPETLREYATAFLTLPEALCVEDTSWCQLMNWCRAAIRDLENESRGAPTFLGGLLKKGPHRTALLVYLGLDTGADDNAIHRRIAAHVVWLLRRAIFFARVPREPHARVWLHYFTAAIPALNPESLGYDHVWLNTGMVVEFLFSVVTIAMVQSGQEQSPGDRVADGGQKMALLKIFGQLAYDKGMAVWQARNDRRHPRQEQHENAPPSAHAVLRQLATCLDFLQQLGMVPSPPAPRGKRIPDKLTELRESRQKFEKRRELESLLEDVKGKLTELNEKWSKVPGKPELFQPRSDELQSKRDSLLRNLEALAPDRILEERHRLCGELVGK
jgi:DNA-binding NarL/FixJ family response regulator